MSHDQPAAAPRARSESAGTRLWQPLPLRALRAGDVSSSKGRPRLALGLVGLVASCVALEVALRWLRWPGGMDGLVSPATALAVSPTLVICIWVLLWIGPGYAVLPATLASAAAALAAGFSLPWSMALALAALLPLATYALAYSAAPARCDMRSPTAAFWFLEVSFGAGFAAAAPAFLEGWALRLDPAATLARWHGLWLGSVLSLAVIALPVLVLLDPRVSRWRKAALPGARRPRATLAATLALPLAGAALIGGSLLVNTRLAVAAAAEHGSDRLLSTLSEGVRGGPSVVLLIAWQVTLTLAVAALAALVASRSWHRALSHEVAARTAAIDRSKERYALATQAAEAGLWDWDLQEQHLECSSEWYAMLAYPEGSLDGPFSSFVELVHSDDREQLEAAIEAHLEGNTSRLEAEHRILHSDGTYRWMTTRGQCVRGTEGRARRMVGVMTDITRRRVAEDQLVTDAFHDQLTGLPNRAVFLDRLSGAIARSRRHGYLFAVLFIDLDRFKAVNDSLGHRAGDLLLKSISERLSGCLRPVDTVARFGGDEFAILLDQISHLENATELAERIQEQVMRPFDLEGTEVLTTASIGIATSKTGYTEPGEVLRDADTAMYRAKRLGKARHQVFDTSMHARSVRLMLLETDLRRGAERDEFIILYQPVIDIANNRGDGFEALIRWIHPQRGAVTQADFLSLAEETGLIVPIGYRALHAACQQMGEWQSRFARARQLSVGVNLSARQLAQPDLVERVLAATREHGLSAGALRLEVRERTIFEDPEGITRALRRLAEARIPIDLDDFGVDTSSLTLLQRLPVDRIKIARSLLADGDNGVRDDRALRAILGVAHSLGLIAVAKGVEREDQLALLRELGCPLAQGHVFSKPLSVPEVDALLEEEPEGG